MKERLNSDCIECLIKKYLKFFPDKATECQKVEYMQKLLKILSEASIQTSAPEIVDDIAKIQWSIFGFKEDYTEIKKFFNSLMLEMENNLFQEAMDDIDPLGRGIRYAMTGNYIDFGAMKDVDTEKLKDLLADSKNIFVESIELELLKNDLQNAKKMVYLTDNCGEIVLDKILIKIIKQLYPQIEAEVIVRGEPVLNDATMEDAKQIGMTDVCMVSDNGSSVAGTCLNRISESAKEKIDSADVIIAKGQGNFETLRFCGRNVYYVFMCKCMMFAQRFGVPQFSGMLVNDFRLENGF